MRLVLKHVGAADGLDSAAQVRQPRPDIRVMKPQVGYKYRVTAL